MVPLGPCTRNGLTSFALKARDAGESEDAVQEKVCAAGERPTRLNMCFRVGTLCLTATPCVMKTYSGPVWMHCEFNNELTRQYPAALQSASCAACPLRDSPILSSQLQNGDVILPW